MSDGQSSEISLRDIDSEHLENVEANREAVEFQVHLSAVPTEIWRQEFEAAYQHLPHALKPPVRIEEDRLHIIYLPLYAGELQAFFNFLAKIIAISNMEARVTEEMHTSSEQEKQKREFREALRGIELPKS